MVRFIPSKAGQKEVNEGAAELAEVPVLVLPVVNVPVNDVPS
jgi:hypothetical protein